MIKKTITLPDKRLRQISKEVKLPLSEEDEAIAKNLISYLELAGNEDNDLRSGIGIAAVQLGFLKRMLFVHIEIDGVLENELLINPKIKEESLNFAAIRSGEGCLSVKEEDKNQEGYIHRKNKIVISGYSYFQKKQVTLTKIGMLAMIYQHEMDHLNGKLFIDRINKKDIWKLEDNTILI